jgi:ABC-type nitrate/sulfonate/bicarbonate transport system permease component
VAVTPTFPSRESLRRLRFRPLDVGVGIGALPLVYAVVRVGAATRAPFHPGPAAATISSSPAELPYYAARSLLRMFVALFFSYAFSLGYAYLAARSRARRTLAEPVNKVMGALTGVDDQSLDQYPARRRAGDVAFTVIVGLVLASFPAYVTGAITAAGGAWNASIVAEIVTYNHHVLTALISVRGLSCAGPPRWPGTPASIRPPS